VKARLVDELRRDEARAAHHLGAHRDAAQGISSFDLVSFCNGENGRHDYRAGVHRPALESVVEVLAVRRGAVDKSRPGGIERARVSDCGATAGSLPSRKRGGHVVGPARRDA